VALEVEVELREPEEAVAAEAVVLEDEAVTKQPVEEASYDGGMSTEEEQEMK